MTRWPSEGDPRDPFPDPPPDRPDLYAFSRLLDGLWAGRVPEPEVAREAHRLQLDVPLRGRSRPLPVGPWLPSEADLVRIATDADPGAGAAAPDLVLGPLADDPLDRRSLEVAIALSAFFPGDGVPAPPWQRWSRSAPIPSVQARAAVRAIARAPLAPWRLEAVDPAGQTATVVDQVGCSPLVCPEGPVALRPVGLPLGGRLQAGMLLIARIAPGPQGWVATCPLAIPGPLPAATGRWIRWLSWIDRLERQSPISTAGLLSRRGHTLSRRILEAAWAP